MATVGRPSLEVSAPDEDMELGSDYGRNDGDEFDIDLDLGDEQQNHDDEDYVLKDAASDIQDKDDDMPDDEMAEGGALQINLTVDEQLYDAGEIDFGDSSAGQQKNAEPQEDDDIIDYDDDEEYNIAPMFERADHQGSVDEVAETASQGAFNTVGPTLSPKPAEAQQQPSPRHESPVVTGVRTSQPVSRQNSEQHQESPTNVQTQQPSREHVIPQTSVNKQSTQDLVQTKEHSEHEPATFAGPGEEQLLDNLESYPQDTGDAAQYDSEPHENESDHHSSRGPEEGEEEAMLHPVTLIYRDSQMSLFPDESDYYFLAQREVAYGSLGEFFQACREVLGNSITEDEELEMHLENLDLFINEDSVHCMNTSLAQLLNAFVRLNELDGNSNPKPVCIVLSTSDGGFASNLRRIEQAINEGKGISQLEFLQSPEGHESEHHPASDGTGVEDQYQDEFQDQDDGQDHYQDQNQDNYEDFSQEYTAENNHADGQEGHQDNEYDNSYEEPGNADFDHQQAFSGENFEENIQDEFIEPTEETETSRKDTLNETSQPNAVVNEPTRANPGTEIPTTETKTEVQPEPADPLTNTVSTNDESITVNTGIQRDRSDQGDENDLIDYDNDDEVFADPEEPPQHGPSSGSSTVQGDHETPQNGGRNDAVGDEDEDELDLGLEERPEDEPGLTTLEQSASTSLENDGREFAKGDLTGDGGDFYVEGEYPADGNNESYDDVAPYDEEHLQAIEEYQEPTDAGEQSFDANFEQYDNNQGYDEEEYTDQSNLLEESYDLAGFDAHDHLEGPHEDTKNVENAEHGNFDYPEFDDNFLENTTEAEPSTGQQTQDDGHDSDFIDFDDDDELEGITKQPDAGALQNSDQPSSTLGTKRSIDALGEGAGESSSPQDIKRVKSS